jgi:hypothetical protein
MFVVKSKSKKIAAKVFIVRAETEEHDVKSRTLETPTLTALENIKNKTDKVLERDKFEELDVQKQNADNNDTQHPHHRHHQEQAGREVRREKQI